MDARSEETGSEGKREKQKPVESCGIAGHAGQSGYALTVKMKLI